MNYKYPFYLVEGKPFMRIGKIQAAVYWGANADYGTCNPFNLAGDPVVPVQATLNDMYSPDYFTEHYKTLTEVVLSYGPFMGKTFTIDLSQQEIVFHDTENIEPTFTGSKVYLRQEIEVPTVEVRVGDSNLVLQIDVGDTVSILHKESLSNLEPVGTCCAYINENDLEKTTFPLYEVPVRLSHAVTLKVKARSMTEREESVFLMVGTHGCIGTDLILNHAVTYTFLEYEPRIKKYIDTMYFSPFKK
jgi:hypothetical protein